MSKDPDSFTWLACGKDMVQFTGEEPQIFDQVLAEWQCEGYREYDPKSTLDQTQQRGSQKLPTWYKVFILIVVLLALASAIGAILHFLS